MRLFVHLQGSTPVAWGLTSHSVRLLAPTNVCFPSHDAQYEDVDLTEFGIETFHLAPRPEYNPAVQDCMELPPLYINGEWVQQWKIVDASTEQLSARSVEEAKRIADKLQSLWAAADAYVTRYLSGVAIGILTIGVIQQNPKALAVTQWSSSVWAEYYLRKALITADSTDDLDFTALGAMPYSVPELQAEIGI